MLVGWLAGAVLMTHHHDVIYHHTLLQFTIKYTDTPSATMMSHSCIYCGSSDAPLGHFTGCECRHEESAPSWQCCKQCMTRDLKLRGACPCCRGTPTHWVSEGQRTRCVVGSGRAATEEGSDAFLSQCETMPNLLVYLRHATGSPHFYDVNSVCSITGRTPLWVAARRLCPPAVRFLLKKGAHPHPDRAGIPFLSSFLGNTASETPRLRLEIASDILKQFPNSCLEVDPWGRTALHIYMIQCCHYDAVVDDGKVVIAMTKQLLPVSGNSPRSGTGRTPLWWWTHRRSRKVGAVDDREITRLLCEGYTFNDLLDNLVAAAFRGLKTTTEELMTVVFKRANCVAHHRIMLHALGSNKTLARRTRTYRRSLRASLRATERECREISSS